MISITSLIKIVRVLSFLEGDILLWISFLFFLSFFTSLYFVMVILSLSLFSTNCQSYEMTHLFSFYFHFISRRIFPREKKKIFRGATAGNERKRKKISFSFFFSFFSCRGYTHTPTHSRVVFVDFPKRKYLECAETRKDTEIPHVSRHLSRKIKEDLVDSCQGTLVVLSTYYIYTTYEHCLDECIYRHDTAANV